jgi:phosphonate transport system substrate-binding protein
MMHRGNLKLEDFRIIFRNPLFPTSSCAYAHDLNPALVAKIKEAFLSFKYPPEMSKAFEGTTNFVPIDYKKDCRSSATWRRRPARRTRGKG